MISCRRSKKIEGFKTIHIHIVMYKCLCLVVANCLISGSHERRNSIEFQHLVRVHALWIDTMPSLNFAWVPSHPHAKHPSHINPLCLCFCSERGQLPMCVSKVLHIQLCKSTVAVSLLYIIRIFVMKKNHPSQCESPWVSNSSYFTVHVLLYS